MQRKKEYRYDLREYQLRNVTLLQAIDKVCGDHGITYYLTDGSLLGAVRHKGFIPWDDDMDIALLRKDYDLLMEHAEEWVPKPFFIVNHKNNPDYPKYFAKFEDTSTTIVENFHLGYAGGIYMDIFPLDDVPDNALLRAIHFYKFNLVRRLLYLVYRNPYKHGHDPSSWMPRMVQSMFSKKWVHEKAQKIITEYKGCKGCNTLMSHDNGLRVTPREVFGTPVRVEFEGIEANAPSDSHAFLSAIYGDDYMELPPVEARRAHYHAYCDLNTPYSEFKGL